MKEANRSKTRYVGTCEYLANSLALFRKSIILVGSWLFGVTINGVLVEPTVEETFLSLPAGSHMVDGCDDD